MNQKRKNIRIGKEGILELSRKVKLKRAVLYLPEKKRKS